MAGKGHLERAAAARALLALDSIGCTATAGVVAAVPSVIRPIDPTLKSRWSIVTALLLTAGVCAYGARTQPPSASAMTAAALVNGGWVAACAVSLTRQRNDLGVKLIGATAVMDATVGGLQWMLRHGEDH